MQVGGFHNTSTCSRHLVVVVYLMFVKRYPNTSACFHALRIFRLIIFCQGAVPAGAELCGGGDMAASIDVSLARLVDGDEDAAIFKRDIGELLLRPL